LTIQEAELDSDGRRRRGQDNRARIVAAMLEIVRGGQINFSAEQVAERAEVGLRTVFRHFQDLETLYREMSVVIEAELRRISEQPYLGATWSDRLMELVDRRAAAFETIAPFRQASDAHRHRAAFLADDQAKLGVALRSILEGLLPAEVAPKSPTAEALDLLLSFEAWSRLRYRQGLSSEAARGVLRETVALVIGLREAVSG
jgi:AcrR family transcriptional regulator